jgi:hypothetical protein
MNQINIVINVYKMWISLFEIGLFFVCWGGVDLFYKLLDFYV